MKLGNIMKQAQELQAGLEQAQEAVKAIEVVGEAGAGLVKVQLNGAMTVSRVSIDPSLREEEQEVLEDLLAAAVNDGIRRAQEAAQRTMSEAAGGIKLPDGFKMPF